MNENVIVSITGTQHDLEDNQPIQTIQPGTYAYTEQKHLVSYEELPESENDINPTPIQCTLEITPTKVHLIKNGSTKTEMIFIKEESCETYYDTPLGTFHMNIFTTRLDIQEEDNSLHVVLDYSLDINYSPVSNCTIEIDLQNIL